MMKSSLKLPYGQSNFKHLIKDGYYFVDKTSYIELLENAPEKYITFLRPRRFGKSLFVSMLEYYYDIKHQKEFETLFGKFYIGEHPSLKKNSFWILKFNFSGIDTSTKELTHIGFLKKVKFGIEDFISKYLKLTAAQKTKILKETEASLILLEFLNVLNKLEEKRSIYLLIDEYDHFTNELMAFDLMSFQESVSGNGYIRKFYEAIKNGTANGLIHQIFITGVSPITLDSLTSGFNISKHLSLRYELNEMMGFTEVEVVTLLKKIGIADQLPAILEDMRKWYDGYIFNREATIHIYNSDMVLYFLTEYQNRGKYPDDMLDSNIASDYSKLRRLFTLKTPIENYQVLQEIVEKKSQKARIVTEFSFEKSFTKHDFLSLLFYLGFLTIQGGRTRLVDLKVPNYVIQKLYFDFFIARLIEQEVIPSNLDSLENSLIEMAFEGNPEPFFQEIEYVLAHLSRRDYQNFDEKHLKSILMALSIQVDTFFVKSEREYRGGYTDILFLQRPPFQIKHQYILELKYLKKKDSKKLPNIQKKAAEQVLNYVQSDSELSSMKNLQVWTMIVVKDKVIRKRF